KREDLQPGRRVPELDGLVVAPRGEAAAVGAEGHAPQPAYVALQAQDLLPGAGVPDRYLRVGVHRKLAADRGEAAAVRAARHPPRGDVVAAAEGQLFVACLRAPQLHHSRTGRGQPPAVRTELYAGYLVRKTTQREHRLTGVQVPHLNFPSFLCCPTGRGRRAL